jgi:hypothetical protein
MEKEFLEKRKQIFGQGSTLHECDERTHESERLIGHRFNHTSFVA